jgi:serine/threonine protein kinase
MLYIVMPYCEGGDLDGYIKNTRKNKTNIPEEKILKWSMQIGLAIHFLAENGLIHRDLKPNNIMLLEGGDLVKVVDFGLAVDMLDTRGNAPVEAGTPYYMAPEILQGVKYTYPVDCWSFGVMLHEMLRLELPFRGKSTADLVRSILEDAPPPIPAHYSSGIKSIAAALLIKDPQLRMGMAGMLMHPLLHPRTLAFPTSYRPKAVEERIRRNQVRQLNAQMEIMPRSQHSSLIGIDHINSNQEQPAEASLSSRSVLTATLNSLSVVDNNPPSSSTASAPRAKAVTTTEEQGSNEEDDFDEEEADEDGGGSRKRQELNAALQAAEVLAKADDNQPPPPNQMNEGDEEEEEEGW